MSAKSRREGSASPLGKRDRPLVLRHPLHDFRSFKLNNFGDLSLSRMQIRLNGPLPQMGHHLRSNEDEEAKIAQNTLVMNRNTLNAHEPSPKSTRVQYFKHIQTFESENKIKN